MAYERKWFEEYGHVRDYKEMGKIMEDIYFPRAIIRERIAKGARVLDIGCAFGYFLKCCDAYRLETYGVDISDYAIQQAREITKAKLLNHDVNGGLAMFVDNFFDLITIFDTIEHLASPYNLLKEVHRVLRPEGKMIITVDNLHAIARIWKRGKWQGFREETHLYLFTPSSLKFLLERSGFEVTRLETPFNPLPKSLRRLASKTGFGGQIWLAARK